MSNCDHKHQLAYDLPVVLIMLLGVAEAAAKMFGMLPAVRPAGVLLLPTVLTDRLPGEAFFIGTTTLLQRNRHNILNLHSHSCRYVLDMHKKKSASRKQMKTWLVEWAKAKGKNIIYLRVNGSEILRDS